MLIELSRQVEGVDPRLLGVVTASPGQLFSDVHSVFDRVLGPMRLDGVPWTQCKITHMTFVCFSAADQTATDHVVGGFEIASSVVPMATWLYLTRWDCLYLLTRPMNCKSHTHLPAGTFLAADHYRRLCTVRSISHLRWICLVLAEPAAAFVASNSNSNIRHPTVTHHSRWNRSKPSF